MDGKTLFQGLSVRGFPEVFESKHNSAMEMAEQNAKEDIIRRLRERSDTPALEELKELLNKGDFFIFFYLLKRGTDPAMKV